MKRFKAWLTRPDANRPRAEVRRHYFSLMFGVVLDTEDSTNDAVALTVYFGRRRLDVWYGHDWRECDCDRCIPF